MEKVRVYTLDISNKQFDKAKLEVLEEKRKQNIESGKNYLYKLRSLYAGLLLRHALISEGMEVDGPLKIDYNAFGKPYLRHGKNFSISHSGNLVIVAVSDDVIGVDAEILQNKVYSYVAPKVLTETELKTFNGLSGKEKLEFFISCWVKKEAYLKYKGTGLDKYPSSIETSENEVNGTPCSFIQLKVKSYNYSLSLVSANPVEVEVVAVSNLKTA